MPSSAFDMETATADAIMWSSHTSLYPSLSSETAAYLEQAVEGRWRGDLGRASRIFEDHLPPSHTVPAVAIERIHLLQLMCREQEVIELCHQTLQVIEETETSNSCVWHLFSLNIGLSGLQVEGRLPEALERARKFRDYLRPASIDSYGSTEVYCFQLYYRIMDLCNDLSRYVDDEEDFVIPDSMIGMPPLEKIKRLREHLQKQRRFVDAKLLVRLECVYSDDAQKFHPWYDWISCAETYSEGRDELSVPLIVRIIDARLDLAKELVEANSCSAGKRELDLVKKCTTLSTLPFAVEFPPFHLRIRIVDTILSASESLKVAVDMLISLAEEAEVMQDRLLYRRCLIDACKFAGENLTHPQDISHHEQIRALRIKTLHKQIHFESTARGEALYLAGRISHLGGITVTAGKSNAAEYLSLVEKFLNHYPWFEIPDSIFSLMFTAVEAATQVGQQELREKYAERMHLAGKNVACMKHFDEELSLYRGDDWFFRNFGTDGSRDYWRKFQRMTTKLIVVWVSHELELGLISQSLALDLLLLSSSSELPPTFSKPWIIEKADRLMQVIYRYPVPTSTVDWDPWFVQTRDWLSRTDLSQAQQTRQTLLVKVQLCRADHFGAYLVQVPQSEWEDLLPQAILARQDYLRTLQSVPLRVISADNIMETKWSVANLHAILAGQPNCVTKGLITDAKLEDIVSTLSEVQEYFKAEGKLERVVRSSNLAAQLLWFRHFLFQSIPITATFQNVREAERFYRQIRMENFVLDGSRSYVARQTMGDYLQMGIFSALAVRYSLRALVQRLSGSATDIPDTFTTLSLAQTFITWVQRSKGQALTDMLGLDAQLPASIIPDPQHRVTAFVMLQEEISLLKGLKLASIPGQLRIRDEIEQLRKKMRQEKSLTPILNIREGISMDRAEIKAISSDLGDVVLVDWVWVFYLDAWDLALVTYRDGILSGIRALEIKLGAVQKWTEQQLAFDDPLKQRARGRADQQLHALDKLVAPLEELTKPEETLVFCPTKVLHRIPLHALKIGGRIAIERNPIVYCQSLSILRLCHMAVEQALEGPPQPMEACVFSPLSDKPGLRDGLRDIAGVLDTAESEASDSPKAAFLEAATRSSIIHFHGHSQLVEETPLKQHLDFTGYALPENEKAAADMLTADEVFDLRLRRPTHVTIMGCSSGRAKISDCDDLLGLVTAFHYAGASSVISALWPIDSRDGLLFSRVFYFKLMEDMRSVNGSRTCDMARAMQAAVLALRKPDGVTARKPYHWAGIVFNGAWLFPKMEVKSLETKFARMKT